MIFRDFGVSPGLAASRTTRSLPPEGAPQLGHHFFKSRTKKVSRQKHQRDELLISIGKTEYSLKRNIPKASTYPWLCASVLRPEGSKCEKEAEKKCATSSLESPKKVQNRGAPPDTRKDGRKEGQRPAGGEQARLHAGNSHPVEEPRVAPPHSNLGF